MELKQLKIYIAGKMNGIPEFNEPMFRRAQEMIEKQGNIGINPHVINQGLDHSTQKSLCMKNDIRELIECDAIMMLDGWRESKGAKLEFEISQYLGLEVAYYFE